MDLKALGIRGRNAGLRKFLEGKARNLCNDVINARFEARPVRERLSQTGGFLRTFSHGASGRFARVVVLEFSEQVAGGGFGGDSTFTELCQGGVDVTVTKM
jgi:hypothetical protein